MPAPQDFDTHVAYAAQQRLDGYAEAVRHAMDRKTRFDRRVLDSKEGEVTFKKGQLVQVYRNDLTKSIGTEHKLTPMWSEPCRIVERILNSYLLETLDGLPLEGEYHARRLREFKPKDGTELAVQQKELEARQPEEQEEDNTVTAPEAIPESESTGTSPKERGPDGTGGSAVD